MRHWQECGGIELCKENKDSGLVRVNMTQSLELLQRVLCFASQMETNIFHWYMSDMDAGERQKLTDEAKKQIPDGTYRDSAYNILVSLSELDILRKRFAEPSFATDADTYRAMIDRINAGERL